MQRIVATLGLAGLLAGACKAKHPPGAITTPPSPPVDGSAQAALPLVNDCPTSLGGRENVARTIRKACGPINVTETLEVVGSLTLEAGVELRFQPGTGLEVGYESVAKLYVQGGTAPDQRVVFTSAGDRAPGAWKGVTLHKGAARSQLVGLDIEFAGSNNTAALTLNDADGIQLVGSSVKNAKSIGLSTTGATMFAKFSGNTFDATGPVAMQTEAMTVGSLAAGNVFGKDTFVEIRGGEVVADATWLNIGAPYRVADDISVGTGTSPVTLTLADVTIAFADRAELSIGYTARGRLIMRGTRLQGIESGLGAWDGVRVYENGDATVENATIRDGGGNHAAGLEVKGKGKLTVGAVEFVGNERGLRVAAGALFVVNKPLTFRENAVAAELTATALGQLPAANVYTPGQRIDVAGSSVDADLTWQPQAGAVVQIQDDITIADNHQLTINGPSHYQWQASAELSVGYASAGRLSVHGRPDARVVFGAVAQGAVWDGVRIYGNANRVDLSHLELSDVAGEGGITVKRGAVLRVEQVTCIRCQTTVAPACGATLDASNDVLVRKPTDC